MAKTKGKGGHGEGADDTDLFAILGHIMHDYTELAEWPQMSEGEDFRLHLVFNAGFLHAVTLCTDYERVSKLLADIVRDKRTADTLQILDKSAQKFWEAYGRSVPVGDEVLAGVVALIDHPDNHDSTGLRLRMDVGSDGGWRWDVTRPGDTVFPVTDGGSVASEG